MFQRILLAWPSDAPPRRALEVARSLAETYAAELAVCCLGDGAAAARAALGAHAAVASLPRPHADRELLRYAHEHAFDLLVVGRRRAGEPLPRRLVDRAALRVLIVPEEPAG